MLVSVARYEMCSGVWPGVAMTFQAHLRQLDGIAGTQRPVLVHQASGRASADGRANAGGELAAARDEVVVNVGLQGVADRETTGLRFPDIQVHVPDRVDDGTDLGVLRPYEIRGVAKALDLDLLDEHGGLVSHPPMPWVVCGGHPFRKLRAGSHTPATPTRRDRNPARRQVY